MNFLAAALLWTVLIPVQVGVAVLRYPLAPVAVTMFSTEDKKHLELPFHWLETIDNDLGGDSGWVNEHIEPGSDPYSDWNRIKWLWRNGGDWVSYYIIGIDAGTNPEYHKGLNIREDGFWTWRDYAVINSTTAIEVYWGWGLYGNVLGKNKFTFTTRITDASRLAY
jgi:hypothetical protein